MAEPMFQQLGVIGCGLMGGSFALACKRAGLVRRVVGYSKSPTTTETARRMGVIDAEAQSALQAVSGSDVVLIAVPVAATEGTFAAIRQLIEPGVLLMDVGSTKRDVVAAARLALRDRLPSFVPAHPIAGREAAGIAAVDAALYQRCRVVLTPLEETSKPLVRKATALWTAIGAMVLQMTPAQHDAAFAAVSHLPHLLAFAYIGALAAQPEGSGYLALAGSGFRDFTRIAASEPTVWRDILTANRDEVLRQSAHFRASLEAMETLIRDGNADGLRQAIVAASGVRAAWEQLPGRAAGGKA